MSADILQLHPIKQRVMLPLSAKVREQYLELLSEQTSKAIAAQSLLRRARTASDAEAEVLKDRANLHMLDVFALGRKLREIESLRKYA